MEARNLNSWRLEKEFIAKIAPIHCRSSSPLQLYVPLLMPLLSLGIPKITPVSNSSSCLKNDSSCKPRISSTISTQNYLTIPIHDNRSFKEGFFWQGDIVKIELYNDNLEEMYVNTKIDNSSDCTIPHNH